MKCSLSSPDATFTQVCYKNVLSVGRSIWQPGDIIEEKIYLTNVLFNIVVMI